MESKASYARRNGSERQCEIESFNLLNEYAEQLYGPQRYTPYGSDFDDELKAEIAAIKSEIENPTELRRFRVVECGLKNRLFIQTTVPNPVVLVTRMLRNEKTLSENHYRSGSLRHMIPIDVTCQVWIFKLVQALMEDIETAAADLFDQYFFRDKGMTFCILFYRHANEIIDRTKVIYTLTEMIKIKCRHPDNKVDRKQPQLTVWVEVIRAVCCLSVLPDYNELHKYNITTHTLEYEEWSCRCDNETIDRTNVIDELAEMIKFRHPGNKIDLNG